MEEVKGVYPPKMRGLSLHMKSRLYVPCVSETLPIKGYVKRQEHTEKVRWICNATVRDCAASEMMRSRLGIESIDEVMGTGNTALI